MAAAKHLLTRLGVLRCVSALCLCAGAVAADAAPPGAPDAILLCTPRYRAAFRPSDGALLSLRQAGRPGNLLWSGPDGLWHARFQDGSEARAADFRAGSPERGFRWERVDGAIRMHYRSNALEVAVTVTARRDGLEFVGGVTPSSGTVMEFALPARLRFSARRASRVVCPSDGNQGVGLAFRGRFFLPQPVERPAAWETAPRGTGLYTAIYGGPLDQRPVVDPPVPLTVTPEGDRLLGSAARTFDGVSVMVNRPPTRAQAELTLLDSVNGPWLSGNRLGGSGALWRIGGGVGATEKEPAVRAITALIRGLAGDSAAGRDRIGVLAFDNGPARGAWCDVAVAEWLQPLRALAAAVGGRPQAVALRSPGEVVSAMESGRFLAVLNPYGEACPDLAGEVAGTAALIARYVRGGGNWLEVGGYSFYCAMRPVRHFTYAGRYPAMFADYLHLDSADGSAGVWRVQPQSAAWEGARSPGAIFVPGTLGCGSDPAGGYLDRAYGTAAPAGKVWRAPVSRITVGFTPEDEIGAYCVANGIRRRLRDKMPSALLARFRRAVLVFTSGSAREKLAALPYLPVPTLIHYSDYLHGGFDKQYPDHLPPNAGFGTESDLREFVDRARAAGHLTMPYANPTWWCDHPKGPTFLREGEAPLLKALDGKPQYERYAANDGWTVCHWHPAVRAANELTRRLFTRDYPSDLLFEDQCGARSWAYDANPSSPTPYAYTDGLLSMVNEDCRAVPLSTEAGWDRVVNAESQLCGMSFALVPTEYGPEWLRMYKETYPASLWTVYPLAQRVAHDKAAMLYHDLGQFVTNRRVVSWTLGLGFAMSYRMAASEANEPRTRDWLRWLDRLQKSVCARYVGEPVGAFAHARSTRPGTSEDGVMRARFGSVNVAANLDPLPRSVGGRVLAPYGFHASAPGMAAGNLAVAGERSSSGEGVSFVTERKGRRLDVWLYGAGSRIVRVEVPGKLHAPVLLTMDDGRGVRASASAGGLSFRLPSIPDATRVVPPARLARQAPAAWTGGRAAIGVLDLPGAPAPTWTRITPAVWLEGLRAAPICRDLGVPVRAIGSVAELEAALEAGPTRWFAIVDPYGEGVPVRAPGRWKQMLSRIRGYVRNGGNWWATGGYTFHAALVPSADGWTSEPIGPAGMAYLGLSVGGGEVEAPSVPLRATALGKKWLGSDVVRTLAAHAAPGNRGLPAGAADPGHVTLVTAGGADYIGGYRLGGWGWLWRVGGFWPDPEATVPTVAACLRHVYTHPPVPDEPDRAPRFWHATASVR